MNIPSIALIFTIAGFVISTTSVQAVTEHCPSGGTKIESRANALVLTADTRVCIKAGTRTTGIVTTDGIRSLSSYLEEAGIMAGRSGEARDVSYYVIYPTLATPTPEPTVSPTESALPTPEITLPPTDTAP